MARTRGVKKPKSGQPSSSKTTKAKALALADPPIQKTKKTPTKVSEILHVATDTDGSHIGYSSFAPDTTYLLVPPSVSRADGDLARLTPPHSPVRVPPNVFTKVKPFPFTRNSGFRKQSHVDRLAKLKEREKTPLVSVWPDVGALQSLRILQDVRSRVVNSGLSFVFRKHPGSYDSLIWGFLASFDPSLRMHEGGREEVLDWSFTLGTKHWVVEADVLRDLFRFPRDEEFPHIVREEVAAF